MTKKINGVTNAVLPDRVLIWIGALIFVWAIMGFHKIFRFDFLAAPSNYKDLD